MKSISIEGSNITIYGEKRENIEKGREPINPAVFNLLIHQYERWLYHALNLEGRNPKTFFPEHTQTHFLVPDNGCILYLKKPKTFTSMLKELIRRFLPFNPGLLGALQVELWDEEDSFREMTVTSIIPNNDDFTVEYISSDGEPMTVKGNDLGDDEMINLLSQLLANPMAAIA